MVGALSPWAKSDNKIDMLLRFRDLNDIMN